MSILCCCSSHRTVCQESNLETPKLPEAPPRVKLTRNPPFIYEPEIPRPPMIPSRAASLLETQMQDTVDPSILDVEDSDDDVSVRNNRKPNISTLESIKTKLIRRLSQRSDTKRFSQQSLGNSEEEIARRAELKRLMRKRIQEELTGEEQNNRTKATCPDEPIYDNCPEPNLPGGGPRDTLEFAVSKVEQKEPGEIDNTCPDTIPLTFPIGEGSDEDLQRRRSCPGSAHISQDNSGLEGQASMKGVGSLTQFPVSPHLSPVHLPSTRESDSTGSWSLSYNASHLASYFCPAEESHHNLSSQHYGDPHGKKENDQGENYNEDGDDAPSQVAGRNSLKRGNLERATTIPDKVHESSLPPQTSRGRVEDVSDGDSQGGSDVSPHDASTDRYSPLDIWLRSQDLQSASAVSSRPTSDMALDKVSDSNSQGALPIANHLSEMPTSPVLYSTQGVEYYNGIQNPPPGAWPQSQNPSTNAEQAWPEIPSNESLALRKVVAQVNSAIRPNLPPPESVQHGSSSRYTSSRYTTRPNSRQPTPKESRLSLTEVFKGRKIATHFTPFHRFTTQSYQKDTERSDSSSYQTAPNETPTPDWEAIQLPPSKRPMTDTISVAISETASFRQREAELRSVEKRFGLIPLHRAPSFPVTSRFREEFDEARNSARIRNSLLARFHLPVSKRSSITMRQQHKDIEGRTHNSRRIPTRRIEHNLEFQDSSAVRQLPVSSNVGWKPHIAESATGLWQRAIRLEADSRRAENGQSRHRSQVLSPNTRIIRETSSLVHMRHAVNNESCVQDVKATELPLRAKSQPPELIHDLAHKPLTTLQSNRKQPAYFSNGVLREWINQVDAEDPQIQLGSSTNSQIGKPRRLRTAPASWAKWPSHSRHERTGAAGVKDNVVSRDFAGLQLPKSDEAPQTIEKNSPPTKKRSLTPIPRTLSSQFSKAMKQGWSKIVPRKDTFSRDATSSAIIHDHQKARGCLEYPELELLPTRSGYKDVRALEREIDNMKRRSISSVRRRGEPSHDSTKPSLTARLAEEVHQLQHDSGGSHSPDIEKIPGNSTAQSPKTPSHVLLEPRAVSGATDEFGTPKSHISYDDCVPTHMLDEEDDNSRTGDDTKAMKHVKSSDELERSETGCSGRMR